jgi:ribose 5-phosphate isomerase B
MKKIAVGSDEAGAVLRHAIVRHLRELGHPVADYGVDDDSQPYPSIAFEVAERVAAGTHDRAILCCGTGVGMAIAANKIPGVYAANCHDVYSAQRARKSNDAQILTLGERVVGREAALVIVDAWLASDFEAGRSKAKVDEIRAREQAIVSRPRPAR